MKKNILFSVFNFIFFICNAQIEDTKYMTFGSILLQECSNNKGYSSFILNNNGFFTESIFNCNASDTIYNSEINEIKFNKTMGKLIYYDSISKILVNNITKTLDRNDSAYTNLYRVVYKIDNDSITFLFLSSLSKLGFKNAYNFFNFYIGENSKYKFYYFSIDYFAYKTHGKTLGYRINQNYYTFKEKI